MPGSRIAGRSRIGHVVALAWALVAASGRCPAQDAGPAAKDDRAEAIRLCRQLRDLEALPLLEKLHKADPADREIKERLACALPKLSPTLAEAERAPMLIRARAMIAELKATGPISDLSESFLAMIPEDGKFAPDTLRKDVAEALRAGEAAFARREFAKARASYETALTLDPTLYQAALFAGDTYFAEGKMDEAIAWFSRATKLDPKQTAAYRYWGDALMKRGEPLEARQKFFLAIVVEPYFRPCWLSLAQWGRANGVNVAHPRVMPPAPKDGEPRSVSVEDGTSHLVTYDAAREAWKAALFKTKYPEEPAYRHSLEEEAAALRALASGVRKGVESGEITRLDPSLANLLKIDREGLVEAYVLLARPDEGIAKDYAPYRDAHREKLFDYLTRYVAPMPDKSK